MTAPVIGVVPGGVVGQLAKLKGTQAREAADRMLSASRIGPLEASRVRNAIESKSPEAWQGVKRAWLARQWDKSEQGDLKPNFF